MVNNVSILFRVGWLLNVIVANVVLIGFDSTAQQLNRPEGALPVILAKGLKMHTDHTYGFAVEYPQEYVILKELSLPTLAQPPVVRRVRIQRKDIAAGQFADLEPPALTIHVFARPSGHSLREWLNSFDLLPPGSEISLAQLPGAREGMRVALRQQLAPNEFLYFTTDQYIYNLIPFGHEGENMLRSFRLIGKS